MDWLSVVPKNKPGWLVANCQIRWRTGWQNQALDCPMQLHSSQKLCSQSEFWVLLWVRAAMWQRSPRHRRKLEELTGTLLSQWVCTQSPQKIKTTLWNV